MIRIADFDSEGMPFLFVGTRSGGRFVSQHVWPEIWLAAMVNKPIEAVVELEGVYQRLFAGASITSAISAGECSVELTVHM